MFSIAFVGDTRVGKTKLINALFKKEYKPHQEFDDPELYNPTHGLWFKEFEISETYLTKEENSRDKIQLIEFGGTNCDLSTRKKWCESIKADCYCIVLNRTKSFSTVEEQIEKYKDEIFILKEQNKKIIFVLNFIASEEETLESQKQGEEKEKLINGIKK